MLSAKLKNYLLKGKKIYKRVGLHFVHGFESPFFSISWRFLGGKYSEVLVLGGVEIL
jgi:hypothetical protein